MLVFAQRKNILIPPYRSKYPSAIWLLQTFAEHMKSVKDMGKVV